MSAPATSLSLKGTLTMIRELVAALRPHQWVKNLLVFVAPFLDDALFEQQSLLRVTMVFLAFCAAASGTYLINDLLDLQSDRQHPRKRDRPFASGRLPLAFAAFGPILLFAGFFIALQVSGATASIVAGYIVLALSYSLFLKKRPLVDVFTLSLLYTVRIYAGQVALDVEPSNWLVTYSGFLFLSLAILKRVSEYQAIVKSKTAYETGRGYRTADIEVLKNMGVASSFASSMVLALYIDSESAAMTYEYPMLLWSVVPILLFWQSRMWLAAARGNMTDDPIVFAAGDWVSWLCLLLLLAIYAVPLML
jgi:4-hydroxybenzoate polyprenyltransferase